MDEDWLDDHEDTSVVDCKSYDKIQKERHTDGFRTGVDDGKEKNLQIGFNEGYASALDKALKLSCMRGKLVAVLCYNMSKHAQLQQQSFTLSKEDVEEIEEMIENISNAEKALQGENSQEKAKSEVKRLNENMLQSADKTSTTAKKNNQMPEIGIHENNASAENITRNTATNFAKVEKDRQSDCREEECSCVKEKCSCGKRNKCHGSKQDKCNFCKGDKCGCGKDRNSETCEDDVNTNIRTPDTNVCETSYGDKLVVTANAMLERLKLTD